MKNIVAKLKGLSLQERANLLHVSIATANTHWRHVNDKLNSYGIPYITKERYEKAFALLATLTTELYGKGAWNKFIQDFQDKWKELQNNTRNYIKENDNENI